MQTEPDVDHASPDAPSLSGRWTLDELRGVLGPMPPWRVPQLGNELRQATIARAEHAAAEPFPPLPATLFLDYFRRGGRANAHKWN